MNTQTQELLKQLASKLGTTSEYLWKILLNQAKIDAITTLIQIGIVVIFAIVLIKIHFRLCKEDKDGYSGYSNNDAYGVIMIISSVFCGALLIIGILSIGDVVNGLLNPEYWALNKILETLRPR